MGEDVGAMCDLLRLLGCSFCLKYYNVEISDRSTRISFCKDKWFNHDLVQPKELSSHELETHPEVDVCMAVQVQW